DAGRLVPCRPRAVGAIRVQPQIFWTAAMHQEYEGNQDPRNEDGVNHIALPPAILGNERRTPRRQEKGTYARAGQGETGGESTAVVKPAGDQRHMGDEANGGEASADQDPIVEIKLP